MSKGPWAWYWPLEPRLEDVERWEQFKRDIELCIELIRERGPRDGRRWRTFDPPLPAEVTGRPLLPSGRVVPWTAPPRDTRGRFR